MTFADLVEFAKAALRDYGSFITGALGLILTCIFGGSLFYKLAQHRIKHLEDQVDSERAAASKVNSELAANQKTLADTEKERNGIKAKLARIQLAFLEVDDEPIWMGTPRAGAGNLNRAISGVSA